MLAACWRRNRASLARCAAVRASAPLPQAAAGPCSARPARPASAARPRSADSPSADSRAPSAGRARERDAQPVVVREDAATASTCGAPTAGANGASSAASRSGPAGVGTGGPGKAPRGRRDRPAEDAGAAVADGAPPQLVAQNEQFDVLGELAATAPHEQPQQRREREICERKEHRSMLPELATTAIENWNLVLAPLTHLRTRSRAKRTRQNGPGQTS